MRKTWFIAGAAGGLGRHLAGTALAAGHDVLAADIDADGLSELKATALTGDSAGRLLTTELDLTDGPTVDRAV
ncbi:hypothetical protein [Nonomuraea guangzhouensis]|uniref:SDR family NAD(P)-dependent oxidoreductase n=1 Tax=Nonomuraea guangzhouensis TaxID=1291555 RepID=A0ABW4GPI3_9ACTN|nr:hypothetical protein [Nonomuraea guangzhouensis]